MHSKLQPPILVIDKQEAAHNYNNAFLKNSSMGLTNFLADFFWVKTLLESDIEHYKKDDLNSWMYLRFKSIAHLDPWFYTNYIYGAIYLSVIKDDIKGASEFIQEGLKYYPEDKTLNQFCLFHFTSEEPNPAVADKCLKAILNNPQVPDFFKMMLINFYKKNNQKELAINLIDQMLQDVKDESTKKRLLEKKEALQK